VPVLAILLLLTGLLIAAVGLLGLRERLPRNRFFGVRTQASLRDEDTFRLANKIAGLPTTVGGLVGTLAGLAALVMPDPGARMACVIIGLVGMLTITVAAGALGHKAALAMPKPAAPAGCGGCACGNCPIATANS
jgi:uncharacterized membrane protein